MESELKNKRACVIARKLGISLEEAKKLKNQGTVKRSFVPGTKTATINKQKIEEEPKDGES